MYFYQFSWPAIGCHQKQIRIYISDKPRSNWIMWSWAMHTENRIPYWLSSKNSDYIFICRPGDAIFVCFCLLGKCLSRRWRMVLCFESNEHRLQLSHDRQTTDSNAMIASKYPVLMRPRIMHSHRQSPRRNRKICFCMETTLKKAHSFGGDQDQLLECAPLDGEWGRI